MGRRKIRNMTYIHSFCLERSLFEELQRRAQASGKSMSMYLEEILRKAFNMDPADPPADPPSNTKNTQEEIDPLVELELEELSEWIRGFEADLAEYQNMKKNPPKPSKKMPEWEAKNVMTKYKIDLQDKKNSLVSDWQFLKKKFEKLRRKIPKPKEQEISKKLADLKRKLISS